MSYLALPRRLLILMSLVACSAATAAIAQDSGSNGGLLGKDLIDGFRLGEYSESGGKGNLGSIEIAGTKLDIGDLSPGASRAEVDALANRGKDMDTLQQQGEAEFNRSAGGEGAHSEAARALATMQPVSVEQALNLVTPEQMAPTGDSDILASIYSDCVATSTTVSEKAVATTDTVDLTCAVGTGTASCGRSRSVTVSYPDAPPAGAPCPEGGCDLGRPKIQEEILFDGRCESEAGESSCKKNWVCTDSAPRVINGITFDKDSAALFGLEILYPGAPAMCWEASATLECPICPEGGSSAGCATADLSMPEGALSCSNLPKDRTCVQTGKACLLSDVDGNCVLVGHHMSCSKPVEIFESTVKTGNTCNQLASNVMQSDERGMPVAVAMAQLAVADAVAGDVQQDGGGAATYDEPDPTDQDGDSGVAWGYDGAPAKSKIDEIQRKVLAEASLFKGKAYSCQKGYAGLIDCCATGDLGAKEMYWEIYTEARRSKQAAETSSKGGTSGYSELASGKASVASLSNPFTSMRDNVIGGGTGSFTISNESVQDQFLARARKEIKDKMSPSWVCSDSEFDLAVQKDIGSCSFAGTYCSQKVLGVCLKRRESYCCYRSPMTKMLRASTEPGGVLNHGSSKSPDCNGIPLDQVDRVNWDQMDFSQLAGNMEQGGMFDRLENPESASHNLTGAGAAVAADGRQNVENRSVDRLEAIDGDSVFTSIAADAATRRKHVDTAVTVQVPRISFSTPYMLVNSGRSTGVSLVVVGSQRPASAIVELVAGDERLVGWRSVPVDWSRGGETQTVAIRPLPHLTGRVTLAVRPTAGTLGENTMITIDVQ